MMSIAIIGSNSFLAKQLFLRFEGLYKMFLFARKKDDQVTDCTFVEFNYPIKPLDLSALEKFDFIIYTAAAGVQASDRSSITMTYDMNFYIPFQIINYLNSKEYKGKVITFGSYFEIGSTNNDKPFTETEVIFSHHPVPNSYCDSKRLLSRYYSNKQYAINWFHLILPSLYGKGEDEKRLIPYLIETLTRGEEPKTSSGEQIRQYLHVKDLVDLISLIITKDIVSDIYNVAGTNSPIRIKELIKMIYTTLDKEYAPTPVLTTRDQSMMFLSLNDEKLKKAAPMWNSNVNLDLGVKGYL